MPTTVPAMKARLGNTDYYILSMKAKELLNNVTIPEDMPGWDDLSVEERYQRDINYSRVKNQIAPYFASDDSHFIGAVILAAQNFDESKFEPLSDIATKGLPGLYRTAASNIGFLTFSGGEVLIPLDGQHRLKAMDFAISGKDERDRPIKGITASSELGNEDITVMLVAYESTKARKIFTKVNRYAKPTTKGQNIITDDDDIVAVITREIANDIIGGRLVKYTSNTLSANDPEFTTLATLYETVETIILGNFHEGKLDKAKLPDDQNKVKLYTDKCHKIWELLVDEIEIFKDALTDKESTGDKGRQDIRCESILGKPVGQACLVKAFVNLSSHPTLLSESEACARLNKMPWEFKAPAWDRVLRSGDKVVGRGSIVRLAVRIIGYMCGEKLNDEERLSLEQDYLREFPEEERKVKKLPDKII